MSSRIVLTAFGSLGDIHPTMALALELQRRGHEAIIVTTEFYRAKIEAEGLGFHAANPKLPESASRELRRSLTASQKGQEKTASLLSNFRKPPLRVRYDNLLPIARECDLLISHPISYAAPLVAGTLGMKWLSTALAPISLWSYSAYHSPPSNPSVVRRVRRVLSYLRWKRIKERATMRATLTLVAPVVELRKELGLPDTGHPLFEGQHSPYGVLALFSKAFASPQPDWPARTHVCGACYYDKRGEFEGTAQEYTGAQLSPEIRAFLEAGEKPIIFTLGSSVAFVAGDFYEQSAQAARLTNRRALLLIGGEENRPRSLPHNTDQIAAFEYAPYGELFPGAAAIVHAGGAGTIARVLESGAPSLVMPFANDQFNNAERLQRLGIARVIGRRKYTARSAAHELSALLEEPEYTQRASKIAEQVRKDNGAKTAANVVENVLQS
jgi:rhamnosyltransferase subunit B